MPRGGREIVFSDRDARPATLAAASFRTALLLAALLVSAAAAASAAMAEETVRVDPSALVPGAEVTVTARGFPPQADVELGAGPPASEYTVLDTGRTDTAGAIRFILVMSPDAPVGSTLVFVVATEDLALKATSLPIEILDPAGVPAPEIMAGPAS